MTTPSEQIVEKNRTDSTGAWVYLFDLTLPDSSHRRFVRDTVDCTYAGNVYTALYFQFRNMRESSDGSLPTVVVEVASAGRPLGANLETIEGCAVVVTRVNTRILSSDFSDRARTYRVAGFDEDEQFYRFTLGPPNLLLRRFPLHVLEPGCDSVFGDHECQYVGSAFTSCGGTVIDCIVRDNINNFGGELGLQVRGQYIV